MKHPRRRLAAIVLTTAAALSASQTHTWSQGEYADFEKGVIKNPGNPLERSGKVVRGHNKDVHDGPFAEAKDLINGYTLVDAATLDQAVELSKGCPIFEDGGAVEVRPVAKL